ncbi:hypothetical protein J4032_10100 [Streptomyces formicae]|uniref:Uncharacterized protein n=1 Tax=Streptomyces formicae TaxID=1616117 RepID=A0ABY3WJI2_9ACTN|nr:hypothetical protein J4032_10100 [Streptomyces formicae]
MPRPDQPRALKRGGLAVLGAAGGSFERCGQASVGFAEDDFGEGAAAVALGQGGGVAADVGGHGAGVPGELEGDLLVVAGFEVRVLPREHGGDERFVRGAVQREFGLDQAVGVVEHDVRVAHQCLAASSWPWLSVLSSGAWMARKRA